jgi:hypothetical protein
LSHRTISERCTSPVRSSPSQTDTRTMSRSVLKAPAFSSVASLQKRECC